MLDIITDYAQCAKPLSASPHNRNYVKSP